MKIASLCLLLPLALLAGCGPKPSRVEISPVECLADPSCSFLMFAGHRGFCGDVVEPENTLASYLACQSAGTPMVEVDVRVTSDGQVVLNHDADVERTTDGETRFPGRTAVSQLTLAEFKSLVMDDPRCTSPQTDPQRCHPASLDELLAATEGLVLLIDYKAGELTPFFEAIKARNAEPRVLFLDANLDLLAQVSAALPQSFVMPRVGSADEARQLLAANSLPIRWIHGDPAYVAELAPELAAKGVRIYANLWHLDAEFIAVMNRPPEEREAYYRTAVWPKLRAHLAQGLAGAGTEYSAPMIHQLYPDGWGVSVAPPK